MFARVFLFCSLSLIPLRMATSQQCEPAEQSESGKLSKVTPLNRKGFKIRTNVLCSATANSHVRATITS